MKNISTLLLILSFSFTAFAEDESKFVYRSEAFSKVNIPNTEGLKVFWWNIGCSYEANLKKAPERLKSDFDPKNQWKNIDALIGDPKIRPDVLILGEYCPKYFQQKTRDRLAKIYKNIYRLKKTNLTYKIRNGLRVFSRYKIKVLNESTLTTGEFLSSESVMICKEEKSEVISSRNFNKKYWVRPLITLEVSKNSKSYKIVPVHLANPWRFFKQCHGKWSAGIELISGKNNPNYNQVNELSEALSEEQSTIIIGDFNAPKTTVLGFASNSYSILTQAFGESVVHSSDVTFVEPVFKFGSYSIDHAFVSGDLNAKYGKVLPFAGSDHLPIYIIVD